MEKENFSFYGLQVSIPDNWRVEINPKNTREKADVVFHTEKGNRFFVSWGKLQEATSHFSNLTEQRDATLKRIRTGQVTKVSVSESRDEVINGHNALFSHIVTQLNRGMFSRTTQERDMMSVHFYCPEKSRYYVIYCLVRDPSEYESISSIFNDTAKSAVCH